MAQECNTTDVCRFENAALQMCVDLRCLTDVCTCMNLCLSYSMRFTLLRKSGYVESGLLDGGISLLDGSGLLLIFCGCV